MEMEREREGQLREVEVKIEKEAETAEAEAEAKAEAEAEAEAEGGLVERWRFQRFSTTTTASNGTGHGVFTEQSVGDEAILIERGTREIIVGVEDIISTPVVNPNPPASKDSVQEQDANASPSINIETTEHGSELRATELYFEALYNKPGKHAFYCPNCKACIDKVLLQSTEDELITRRRERDDYELRCPSCFEFLKPIGDWIFRKPATSEPGIHEVLSNVAKPTDSRSYEIPSNETKPTDTRIYEILSDEAKPTNSRIYEIPPDKAKPTGSRIYKIPPDEAKPTDSRSYEIPSNGAKPTDSRIYEIPLDEAKPTDSRIYEIPPAEAKPTNSRSYEILSNAVKPTDSRIYNIPLDEAKPTSSRIYVIPPDGAKPTDSKISEIPFDEAKPTEGEQVIVVDPSPLPATTPSQQGVMKYEILKSLVYGGLIELITSLGVVTSAASADATTLNIVALALANLITGVFLIGHNLQELKNDQSTVVLNETDEQVDRYQELLGQKRNFVLHASVAILSFLVFGLVPPVVYGFSFYQSDNRNLKLAVAAAAGLLCIAVLAIVKAYTQKPSKWSIYITTILYYLSIGIGASGISYLAGYLVRKLIEKLGWFESSVATIQPMSFEKLAWESY
ncbi:membrane protein of ER body-like protein isoform X5 [Quercus lobata]|uniref:membrane protein of ER body-like protein isoform X5 n=1 Tax=Quercus lobata TaxID=97700 RepID=UPI001246E731|nr:membrane protein of ER body-like protein isoform X5 [Quercus lobata]